MLRNLTEYEKEKLSSVIHGMCLEEKLIVYEELMTDERLVELISSENNNKK